MKRDIAKPATRSRVMSTNARSESRCGDDWWWSGATDVTGSLNPAIATFSIDTFSAHDSAELWALLQGTRRQFPDHVIQCSYDAQVKALLDQLQHSALLHWSDVGNPYSRYARIAFAPPRSGRSA